MHSVRLKGSRRLDETITSYHMQTHTHKENTDVHSMMLCRHIVYRSGFMMKRELQDGKRKWAAPTSDVWTDIGYHN